MSGDVPVEVVLMRGGTSKGVFLRSGDVPPDRTRREAFLLRLMGSPDPMQIDGLGGTHSSTSKVMLIGPPAAEGDDVDYEFVQIGVDRAIVDIKGNCGNLTAAVGAYAVDEGFVAPTEPVTIVRMRNRNTGRRIVAHVPVTGGRARSDGDTAIAGVPGTGAPIVTEYLDPAGAVTGALLPTGRTAELLTPSIGAAVRASIVDVTAPVVFVAADDTGVDPSTSPSAINADPGLLARLESIRATAAVAVGFVADEASAAASSTALPRLVLVAPPEDSGHDIAVLAMSMQRAHHAVPLTTAMCVAAAARLPGTVAAEAATAGTAAEAATAGTGEVRIAHPRGVLAVTVDIAGDAVRSVSVVRTARRLLAGTAYVGQ